MLRKYLNATLKDFNSIRLRRNSKGNSLILNIHKLMASKTIIMVKTKIQNNRLRNTMKNSILSDVYVNIRKNKMQGKCKDLTLLLQEFKQDNSKYRHR